MPPPRNRGAVEIHRQRLKQYLDLLNPGEMESRPQHPGTVGIMSITQPKKNTTKNLADCMNQFIIAVLNEEALLKRTRERTKSTFISTTDRVNSVRH
jgi:hypothetical protein